MCSGCGSGEESRSETRKENGAKNRLMVVYGIYVYYIYILYVCSRVGRFVKTTSTTLLLPFLLLKMVHSNLAVAVSARQAVHFSTN